MFDWNDLRHLLAIARAGSFAGAARELGVKHTTVSRRLDALEAALGVQLVRRGGERLVLTPRGEDVVAGATSMKEIADTILRRVAGADDAIAGVVRVTLPDPMGGYLVPRLAELREIHPELIVNLLADLRVYDLLAGEADIAIRLHPGGEEDLLERRLGPAAWSLYASVGYLATRGKPASTAELATHALLGFESEALQGSPGGVWFRENLPQAAFVMRFNGILQILNAVLLGIGVGALPCFLGDGEPTLVRITGETFSNRRIRVLVPPDLAKVPRVRAVLDFLVATLTRDEALFAGRQPQRARDDEERADSEEERRFELLDPAKDRRFSKPPPPQEIARNSGNRPVVGSKTDPKTPIIWCGVSELCPRFGPPKQCSQGSISSSKSTTTSSRTRRTGDVGAGRGRPGTRRVGRPGVRAARARPPKEGRPEEGTTAQVRGRAGDGEPPSAPDRTREVSDRRRR